MPVIKFKHVTSVSSEDTNHPAENLLSLDTYRKWHCSTEGEKQAVVVLEFEKSSQIQSVDLGNNGSAFIEVLVGKSSGGEDYQVLLVASSFMSPAESKSWSNTNRVRMFGKEKLSKIVVDQKWDRVKIVCTQPFNKTEKYGLSFVTLHSPPEVKDGDIPQDIPGTASSNVGKKIGIFSVKEEVTSLPSGSLFFKKGEKKDTSSSNNGGSLAVKARQASTKALKEAESTLPVKQDKPVFSKSPKTDSSTKETEPIRRKHPTSVISKEAPPTKKPKVEERPDDTSTGSIIVSEIMKGVVFTLSGFKNPYRGDLRSKAIEMGAEYESDWGPSCTHLVCAFANTPKFNQVKAKKGLVVKKEWILDSHKYQKKLSASKYRFSSGKDSDSEIEFYNKKEKELFRNIKYTKKEEEEKKAGVQKKASTPTSTPTSTPVAMVPEEDDPYGGSTDEASDMETETVGRIGRHGDSEEYDTEDEIERVKQKEDSNKRINESSKDEEMKSKDVKSTSLLDLPNIFSTCYFFLYGNFSSSDERMIRRYITAYNGHIEDYMSDKVTHVITMESWDDNFDQALCDNSSLMFIKPNWIFKCHSHRSIVPCQPYAIVPS